MSQRVFQASALLAFAFASIAHGQEITIVNNDAPGEGFNDPTPRISDIDGQPTTLGQDRLDCFAAAAQVWADYLNITVSITIAAEFNDLGGSAFGAVLGFAGPTAAGANFTGTPIPNMLFVAAEANQFAGADLVLGPEMSAEFNSEVDGPIVLGSVSWYYGTDGFPPFNEIDFFSTAMHELGHALGFLSLMDDSTGELFFGLMDIYTNQLQLFGQDYSAMTNAQRAAANVSDQVVWKGPAVIAAQGAPQRIYSPNPLEPGSSISHWDVSATPNLLMEPFATDAFTGLTLEREAFADLLWPIAVSEGDGGGVQISLYRDSLTLGDRALYDEILGHFADAVLEATEGAVAIYDISIFQDGEPVFDAPPQVSIVGANPVYLDVGETYSELGATAFDAPDGNLTPNIQISGSVNTSIAGTYSVSYSVEDSAGNFASAVRTVHVIGKPPVLVLLGTVPNPSGNPLYVFEDSVFGEADDPFAVALDVSDGNITNRIERTGFPLFPANIAVEGTYFLNYTVTDSQGNSAEAVRTVIVVPADSDDPQIIVNGLNPVFLDAGTGYVDAGAMATDLTDGNITNRINVTGADEVDVNVEGTYQVTYSVTDLESNGATATRIVHVIGKDPELSIVGANPVYVELGSEYVDAGAFAFDVTDGNITGNILTSNGVDWLVPGSYIVSYTVADSGGNSANASRVVKVVGSFDRAQDMDIVWLPRGVPAFRQSGGIGTSGGQVVMYDIFEGGEAGLDFDFLATPENRRVGGYVLAALWLQYVLGVAPEFAESTSDVAVLNSLLADPFTPATVSDATGLNVSSTQDAISTGGIFDPLEHTGATPQQRINGASAWATIARNYHEDPKSARRIAKRPRTFFPEVAINAPVGTAAPSLDLGAVPTGTFGGGRYSNAGGVQFLQTFFRIGTENSLPVVSGTRKRAQNGCLPGRLIDVDVQALGPLIFEFPADSDLREMLIVISTPCFGSASNLDVRLTDAEGRVVNPASTSDPTVIWFRTPMTAPGPWRLQVAARTFTAEGVQIDVLATGNGPTHRLSAELVHAPSPQSSNAVTYPNPIVFQVSDTSGQAIRGATVKGNLTIPTGAEQAINFLDDGSGADLFANDGSYAAVIPYAQNGVYRLELSAVDLASRAAFTSAGTSRAPTLGFFGAEATPLPLDAPVGEPYMRGLFFNFSVTGLEPDDHGETFLEATNLLLNNADMPGRVDLQLEKDYFRFVVAARGATADTVARVTNVTGRRSYQLRLVAGDRVTELGRGAPGPSRYVMVRQDLAPGTYFLEVTSSNALPGDTYSVSVGPPIVSDTAGLGIDVAGGGSGGGGGGGGGGGCFIATAAYGTPLESRIDALRGVRDAHMLDSSLGAAFVETYYRLSPPMADAVARNAILRDVTRMGIGAVLAALRFDARAIAAFGAIAMVLAIAGVRRVRKNWA